MFDLSRKAQAVNSSTIKEAWDEKVFLSIFSGSKNAAITRKISIDKLSRNAQATG
jgi:hypothetical protein